MDPGGSGAGGNIEAYWDGATFGDNGGRTSIADLPALTGNAWYRFHVDITKLTATSARLDVTLTELDGSGNEGAVVASGNPARYRRPAEYGRRSHSQSSATSRPPPCGRSTRITPAADGAVDNPCFGIYGGTPIEYTLTANTVGDGTVILDPPGGVYNGRADGHRDRRPGSRLWLRRLERRPFRVRQPRDDHHERRQGRRRRPSSRPRPVRIPKISNRASPSTSMWVSTRTGSTVTPTPVPIVTAGIGLGGSIGSGAWSHDCDLDRPSLQLERSDLPRA